MKEILLKTSRNHKTWALSKTYCFFANANLAFSDDFLYVSNTYLHVTTSVSFQKNFILRSPDWEIQNCFLKIISTEEKERGDKKLLQEVEY